jgi:hypothetical protein
MKLFLIPTKVFTSDEINIYDFNGFWTLNCDALELIRFQMKKNGKN